MHTHSMKVHTVYPSGYELTYFSKLLQKYNTNNNNRKVMGILPIYTSNNT